MREALTKTGEQFVELDLEGARRHSEAQKVAPHSLAFSVPSLCCVSFASCAFSIVDVEISSVC